MRVLVFCLGITIWSLALVADERIICQQALKVVLGDFDPAVALDAALVEHVVSVAHTLPEHLRKKFYRTLEETYWVVLPLGRNASSVHKWDYTRRLTVNETIRHSPMNRLTLAHEIEHVKRSLSPKDRFEPAWSYSFIQNDESIAFGSEYDLGRKVFNNAYLEQIQKANQARWVKNKSAWIARGLVDANQAFEDGSIPFLLGKRSAKDSVEQDFLDWDASRYFARQIKDILTQEREEYIADKLKQYRRDIRMHQIMLFMFHSSVVFSTASALIFELLR